jgi:hypothetical protein
MASSGIEARVAERDQCSGDLFVSRARNGFSCVIPGRGERLVITVFSLTVRPDRMATISAFPALTALATFGEGCLALGEEKSCCSSLRDSFNFGTRRAPWRFYLAVRPP